MILDTLKYHAKIIRDYHRDRRTRCYFAARGISNAAEFDLATFKKGVEDFVASLCLDGRKTHYRYSRSCSEATLYASTYACITYGLTGKLVEFGEKTRRDWISYFDSFQNPADGLFYDPVVRNAIYDNIDWWGARHLALHIIIAYAELGAVPRYQFRFLDRYCEPGFIETWLGTFDWTGPGLARSDIDNKIMNVGCLLQFERDNRNNEKAGDAVERLKDYLIAKINPATGLWGALNPRNRYQRSRLVQFAYHLFSVFFHDGSYAFDLPKVVETVLQTQNEMGGYGVMLNSSACEDIDSIDILVRFRGKAGGSAELDRRIDRSLAAARDWILQNRMEDGGFVFRVDEPFVYGHPQMSSASGEGALFPTWFRTLSLALLDRCSGGQAFSLRCVPGYMASLKGISPCSQ